MSSLRGRPGHPLTRAQPRGEWGLSPRRPCVLILLPGPGGGPAGAALRIRRPSRLRFRSGWSPRPEPATAELPRGRDTPRRLVCLAEGSGVSTASRADVTGATFCFLLVSFLLVSCPAAGGSRAACREAEHRPPSEIAALPCSAGSVSSAGDGDGGCLPPSRQIRREGPWAGGDTRVHRRTTLSRVGLGFVCFVDRGDGWLFCAHLPAP